RGGDGDAGGVRAAAPERRDRALVIDALEAGDDRDLALAEAAADALRVDGADARARMGAVRRDLPLLAGAGLPASADAARHDRAVRGGGHDDVDLAVVGVLLEVARERQQAVGLAGHRRDDDGDVVALALRLQAALADALHARDRAHGRAAVLLHDEHAERLL